ncbi:SLATT domain-containing protein [Rhizobium sp. Root1204]|uniref:SLATT domain-containing protein n=1 Tax=Rhizobium sp. Root1204 TaxID=1736428 RepID=UPI00071295DA|nr:SLATT domain-containing protein [Rhizobium sp. Root1204]KQV31139.1 hypothetical protein ASC96_08080 [Rhizobium sp. Root1204]
MEKTIADLLRSLKTTAGARFNASKRLSHVDKRLTALTAFTSAFIIALTVFPKFVVLTKTGQSWLELTTIALSILLLASSVLQYASNHAVKAELFHRSALEMQELKRELQFRSAGLDEPQFMDISRRYNEVLQKYALNHDDVDFWRQQLDYRQDFQMSRWSIVCKTVKVWCAYVYPSIILFIIAAGLILVTAAALIWPETEAVQAAVNGLASPVD